MKIQCSQCNAALPAEGTAALFTRERWVCCGECAGSAWSVCALCGAAIRAHDEVETMVTLRGERVCCPACYAVGPRSCARCGIALTAPELAAPELAAPELAAPELAAPELAAPELTARIYTRDGFYCSPACAAGTP